MIRDKIVFSTKEKTLKERLLRETDTSLQKVIDICLSGKITKKEIQSMQSVKCDTSSSTESSVHVIKSSLQNSPVIDTTKKQHVKCRRCGNPHAPRQCPAWGKICAKCNRPNHFAREFRSKGRVHEVAAEESEGEDDFYFDRIYVGNIDAPHPQDSAWFSVVNIEGSSVKMKLDTGAATNLLPH